MSSTMTSARYDNADRKLAEDALRASEERYRELFENATMGIFHSLPEGRFVRVNPAMARMVGYGSPDEMVASITDIATQLYVDPNMRKEVLARVGDGQWIQSENHFWKKDHTTMFVNYSLRGVLKRDGTVDYMEGFIENISARKEAEEEQRLTLELLHLINSAARTIDLVPVVAAFLKKRFACDAIGIRLLEGNDFPYFETAGFPMEFIFAENSLCARTRRGETIRDRSGMPVLECLCGAVARADFDAGDPCFSEYGSFSTGRMSRIVAQNAGMGREVGVRNGCAAWGYESVALVPLKMGDKRLGLLQLNNRREDSFLPGTISLLERVADRISIALARVRAEEALQKAHVELEQRVLERTTELVRTNKQLNREIEERKRTEEQLQESKTTLQMVFDGISEPLVMLNGKMRVQMLNRAAREYFRLHEYKEALGKKCFEGLRGRSEPCGGCERPFCDLNDYSGAYERKCPTDPNKLERVVVYRSLHESTGEEASIIRISDITRARLMEKHLIRNEKLASLGLLLSGIAHEINNPNSFISFNIPILRDYLNILAPIVDVHAAANPEFRPYGMSYQEFREDLYKLVDNMEHGSGRINATVARLKEFVTRRENVERQRVDLRQIVEKAVMLCRSEINKRVKSFSVKIPETLSPVESDPDALEQVIINLLINAAHAADKDESWIVLEVLSGSEPRYCAIEVSDNGHGMDEATRRKVFDPFFTTKSTMKGTGLGLYLCHNLMEELGGRIEVESQAGTGSTFRVILHGDAGFKI